MRQKYSRLSLSRSLRDSLEYFEISVPRHIRFAELRKTINRTTTFNKWICNLTPEVNSYIENIVEKRREQFLLFSTIFWYLLLDSHVRKGTRFSLRDKRLFEISEVEITRVDCILPPCQNCTYSKRKEFAFLAIEALSVGNQIGSQNIIFLI